MHIAYGLLVYCYLKFKLRYLKNLKLFSIRVKKLFEPIVLERKCDGFIALFKSIFMRNWSLSNAKWFYGKKCEIGKGNLYLTGNRLSRNEMWCEAGNHNCISHICAKGFLYPNLNYAVMTTCQIFKKLLQILHINSNRNFYSIIVTF